LFVDARGLPLRYIAVKGTFDGLVGRAGIIPAAKRRPRLHDLRHDSGNRIIPATDVKQIYLPGDHAIIGACLAE
jgi:integrase/recombinase XerD